MNEDRGSVYTAVTTHMVLLKVKDGLITWELGHRGQGGDPVQATLCPVETPARIKPDGHSGNLQYLEEEHVAQAKHQSYLYIVTACAYNCYVHMNIIIISH